MNVQDQNHAPSTPVPSSVEPAVPGQAPTPRGMATAHDPLDGIHDLPVEEQIARYRTAYERLSTELHAES